MLFVVGGVVVAVLAFAIWWDRKLKDDALDLALVQIHRRAKATLPEEDLARLHVQLHELAALGREAHHDGVSARQATKMSKRAAIETIAGFIAVEQMFAR